MQTETKAAKLAIETRKTLSKISTPIAETGSRQADKPAMATTADVAETKPARLTVASAPPTVDAAPNPSSSNVASQGTALTGLAAAWSDEDEKSFQALLGRRKAAGLQRRGRDVAQQLLCAGKITPNAGTVVATIVGLVTERGTVKRGVLIEAMGDTVFPHAKARPSDRNWCQGYVAGALRDGFLAVAGEHSPGNVTSEAPK